MPDLCKQCGYNILELRDDDFCSDGCKQVYEACAAADAQVARQEGR